MSLPAPLISAAELLQRLAQPGPAPLLLDCSFDLADTEAGRRAHAQAHLPGAHYAHLEADLSAPHDPAGPIAGGRHPLPTREDFAARVGAWGLHPGLEVVVYDNQGAPYAARAWWMLRWLGHRSVRVLDGGLAAWQAAGGTVQAEPVAAAAAAPAYPVSPTPLPTVDAPALLAEPGRWVVVDARAPERFRGEVEPLDRQAGHIPGARNRFFKDNLQADGRFKPAAELQAAFAAFGVPPERLVSQCGSGVTACHNLLALAIAGLDGAALYPGSWSEWSADPTRPVARS